MTQTLTPLFRAPDRIGRLDSMVCRCSCGSLSEIYTQYFQGPRREELTPEQAASGRYKCRKDRCNDCDTDAVRKRAPSWFEVKCRRDAGYGQLTNSPKDRKPKTPEQAEYFRLAPQRLQPGFVTFKPGEYERAASTQTFTDVQRVFAKATAMLYQRGKDLPLGDAFDRTMQHLANAIDNMPRIPASTTSAN